MDKNFDTIVLGGGSIKGLYELGAVRYLEEIGYYDYKNVKNFMGTSAGAMIALLLSTGMSPVDILRNLLNINTILETDLSLEDILNFKEDGGILEIDVIVDHVKNMIKKKYNIIPTMKDLYLITKKRLVITTTNVSKSKAVYIDYNSHPDMSCIDALKMSCCIPLVFKRITYQGEFYVDGGITDNFPIKHADNGINKTMGICVEEVQEKGKEDFLGYLYKLINVPINEIQKRQVEQINKKTLIVYIKTKGVNSLNFNVAQDVKTKMFVDGYNVAKEEVDLYEYENF